MQLPSNARIYKIGDWNDSTIFEMDMVPVVNLYVWNGPQKILLTLKFATILRGKKRIIICPHFELYKIEVYRIKCLFINKVQGIVWKSPCFSGYSESIFEQSSVYVAIAI